MVSVCVCVCMLFTLLLQIEWNYTTAFLLMAVWNIYSRALLFVQNLYFQNSTMSLIYSLHDMGTLPSFSIFLFSHLIRDFIHSQPFATFSTNKQHA